MDPDMVRQQEEAEQAARLRAAQPQPPAQPLMREIPVPGEPLAFLDPPFAASRAQPTRAELNRMAPAEAVHTKAPHVETAEPGPAPAVPERFPKRWTPVFRKEARQNRASELRSDSVGTEKALEPMIAQVAIADAANVAPTDSAPVAPFSMPVPSVETPPIAMPPVRPVPPAQLPARHMSAWGDAALLCTVLTGGGIVGGIAVAAKAQLLGASDHTSFTQLLVANSVIIGAAAGFFLGWLGAALKLRMHGISMRSALGVSLLPTIFVLISEASAAHVADTMPSAELYAAVIVAGGVIAFVLAFIGIGAGAAQRPPNLLD